jgi:hypothetical protein
VATTALGIGHRETFLRNFRIALVFASPESPRRNPGSQALVFMRPTLVLKIPGLITALLLAGGCGGSSSSTTSGTTSSTTNPVFACSAGQDDMMTYFAMSMQLRQEQFMSGQPNPIYTEVFPNLDFASSGYWFWLKSADAHGFDVKAFDPDYIYIRTTELDWDDNTTFKRFVQDLPIAARCVGSASAGPDIPVADTTFQYFFACAPYQSSQLGTALNSLDAPVAMDTGGNPESLLTRVLHYRYNCDSAYQNCVNEEQFFLGSGYGLWQWKHYQNGTLVTSSIMNNIESGSPTASLPCPQSYNPQSSN